MSNILIPLPLFCLICFTLLYDSFTYITVCQIKFHLHIFILSWLGLCFICILNVILWTRIFSQIFANIYYLNMVFYCHALTTIQIILSLSDLVLLIVCSAFFVFKCVIFCKKLYTICRQMGSYKNIQILIGLRRSMLVNPFFYNFKTV